MYHYGMCFRKYTNVARSDHAWLRAVPPVLSVWPCKENWVAQQNGFDPAFLHWMQRLVKAMAKPNTCC